MAGDPVKALLKALYSLAVSRGSGIAGIALAGGQDRVKIDVRAFYKHHDEETGYTLFSEALQSLTDSDYKKLEDIGIRLHRERGTLYIEVPVDLLRDPRRIEEMIGNDQA
ncbi:MAG: hypothetical protein F7C33_06440 [Desulfurococcales archaeon]|nr:hypothetical protein [Desulfurococcales archaeon]